MSTNPSIVASTHHRDSRLFRDSRRSMHHRGRTARKWRGRSMHHATPHEVAGAKLMADNTTDPDKKQLYEGMSHTDSSGLSSVKCRAHTAIADKYF